MLEERCGYAGGQRGPAAIHRRSQGQPDQHESGSVRFKDAFNIPFGFDLPQTRRYLIRTRRVVLDAAGDLLHYPPVDKLVGVPGNALTG